MKRIAPLEVIENSSPNDVIPLADTYESNKHTFLSGLYPAIINDNNAFFYHPKARFVKASLQKALTKSNIQISEEKHFICNYRNVLEVADKIIKQNFDTIFYVIDHSKVDVFSAHKKDKLFLAISKNFGNILKTIIIINDKAYMYE